MSALRFRPLSRRWPFQADVVSRPPFTSVLVAAISVAWSVAVIDEKLAGVSLPGPARLSKLLPYAVPGLLVALLFIRRKRTSWLDELSWIWVTLVLLAVLLLPKLVEGSITPWILPMVAVAAVIAHRWPTATLLVALLCSAGQGSLHAFWNFPSAKVIAGCLGGLWVASLAGLLLRGSRPMRISAGLMIFVAYLLITALMVPLAPDTHVARLGFQNGAWYMLVVPLVATAGWRLATLNRIANAIIVVALAAALYAIYRIVVGPARQEFALFATTPFNFVNGKLKPGGSFNNAQDMGTWMAAVVPFLFAMTLARRDRWRAAAAVACALCTFCVVESQTRIALVGIVVGLLLALVLFEGSRGFPGRRLNLTVSAAIVGAALIAVGLIVTGNHSGHSFAGVLHPFSDPSYLARKYKWTQALSDLATRPFGYGVGTASGGESTAQVFFAAGDTSVDNGYLKIALEQGLLIMGVFVLALVAIVIGLARTALAETLRDGAGIAIGAASTLLSFAVVMLAEDATANPRSLPTWLITGLGLAVFVSAWRWRAKRSDSGSELLRAGLIARGAVDAEARRSA